MFAIKTKMAFEVPYTMVSNVFIDDYMVTENPVFVLVYLAFLRQCAVGITDCSVTDIAKSLHILESDVINGLKYWHKQGLVVYEETAAIAKIEATDETDEIDETEEVFSLSFLEPIQKAQKADTQPTAKKPDIGNVIDYKPKQTATMEARPNYAVEELEMYRAESEEIKHLFATAEQTLGKLLAYNDMNTLFSLYDWLGLPVAVIEVLLVYCSENDHKNMRYIEKAALDWAENEIDTEEAAKEYIKLFNTEYRAILKAFGHTRRNPTPSEIQYMKKWLTEYQLPLDIVLEACDKTIMQIGQPKFSYAEKILAEWFAQGVKTIDHIKDIEQKFYASKEKQPQAVKKEAKRLAATKPNRFANFKQREWDYAEIEKLEQQYLRDSLTNK